MPHKTNAVRLLEQSAIRYELKEYELDPQELSAELVAAKIGMSPSQVFKALVAQGDRKGICKAGISANAELDVGALAAASGDRKIHLLGVKQLHALTGYIRGGVTAIGGKKDYPVYADQAIERFDKISVSAGIRGLQMVLDPADYLRLTKASLSALARMKPGLPNGEGG